MKIKLYRSNYNPRRSIVRSIEELNDFLDKIDITEGAFGFIVNHRDKVLVVQLDFTYCNYYFSYSDKHGTTSSASVERYSDLISSLFAIWEILIGQVYISRGVKCKYFGRIVLKLIYALLPSPRMIRFTATRWPGILACSGRFKESWFLGGLDDCCGFLGASDLEERPIKLVSKRLMLSEIIQNPLWTSIEWWCEVNAGLIESNYIEISPLELYRQLLY